jgi:hypothetical protein
MAKKQKITVAMVDELVEVRAQLKELKAREEALKKIFRAAGEGTYAGDEYQVEITFTTYETVDMDAVRDALPPHWFAANMKETERMNVKSMVIV